jgi:cation diffusion facilitator CzcD-associated flavoprotein CzcO
MPKGIPQNLPMSSLKIIHPQKWPENLNVVDKTIIVIGSGATAVTIVPELAAEENGYYAATITNLYCRSAE